MSKLPPYLVVGPRSRARARARCRYRCRASSDLAESDGAAFRFTIDVSIATMRRSNSSPLATTASSTSSNRLHPSKCALDGRAPCDAVERKAAPAYLLGRRKLADALGQVGCDRVGGAAEGRPAELVLQVCAASGQPLGNRICRRDEVQRNLVDIELLEFEVDANLLSATTMVTGSGSGSDPNILWPLALSGYPPCLKRSEERGIWG